MTSPIAENTVIELPPISYRRSRRARYLRISVHRTRAVTVTIPRGTTQAQAETIVASRLRWINKQLSKIDRYSEPEDMADDSIDLDQAQQQLIQRLQYFANKYGLDFNRVAFRCQKTKWGSCSPQNSISLNINICLLPDRLQDYVLLHELTHTKIKNHSKTFWNQLDKYTGGNAKELSRQLRKYRMKIKK